MAQQQQARLQAGSGAASSCCEMRTFTFGIGPYANQYFLKQLAEQGRGKCDICLYSPSIKPQIDALMSATNRPILSDISVSLPFLQGPNSRLDTSPALHAIPDLTMGAPVLLTGEFNGAFPATSVSFSGRLASGQTVQMAAPVRFTPTSQSQSQPQPQSTALVGNMNMPIRKLYQRSKIESLVGACWLQKGWVFSLLSFYILDCSLYYFSVASMCCVEMK